MTRRRTLDIVGMSCTGCERNVESALQTVPGVRRAEANHEAGTVEVVAEDDVSDENLGTIVHDAGYEVA